MVLRSDEMASQSQIESNKRFNQGAKDVAKNATSFALGAGGAAASSRVLPFLSDLIPKELAMKGINMVAPEVGKILKRGQEQGLNVEDGLNYLKEKLGERKEGEDAKETKNIIEQISPELHQFILDEIKKGTNPVAAGLLAYNEGKFKDAINKLKEKTKLNWGDLVNQIFGSGEKALENKAQNLHQMIAPSQTPMEQPAQQTPQQARDMAEMGDAGMMRGEQPKQSGQGEQKLMAAIEQLRKLRGG